MASNVRKFPGPDVRAKTFHDMARARYIEATLARDAGDEESWHALRKDADQLKQRARAEEAKFAEIVERDRPEARAGRMAIDGLLARVKAQGGELTTEERAWAQSTEGKDAS
jgi:hypothetical protein